MNGCGPSVCGPDLEQLKLLIKSIIFDMLNDGTLQAGLKDCGDDWLGKGRHVVLCDMLADLICDLITEGKLCVPKIDSFTTNCQTKTLTLTLSDGTELTADASCLGGGTVGVADGNTKIQSFTYDVDTGIVNLTDTDNNAFQITIARSQSVTNESMVWDADKQVVSVTDTASHTVKTVVQFNSTDAPPKNQGFAPTEFIGKNGTVGLGEPGGWIRMLMPDGRVGKVPIFFEDVALRCAPVTFFTTEGLPGPMPLSVLAVVKDGDTWTDVKNQMGNLPSARMEWRKDNIDPTVWTTFGNAIAQHLNAVSGEHFNYSVLTEIGWVKLSELTGYTAGSTISFAVRTYGKKTGKGNNVAALSDHRIAGVDTAGNVVSPASAECGFAPYNSASTGNPAPEIIYLDQVESVPKALPLPWSYKDFVFDSSLTDAIRLAKEELAKHRISDGSTLVLRTPYGVLDTLDAFDGGELVVDNLVDDIKIYDHSAYSQGAINKVSNLETGFVTKKSSDGQHALVRLDNKTKPAGFADTNTTLFVQYLRHNLS